MSMIVYMKRSAIVQKRVYIDIPVSVHNKLRRAAHREGVTMKELVTRLILYNMKRKRKEVA